MAGDGFDGLDATLLCGTIFGVTTVGVAGTGVGTVLLNSAFEMATTGENSLRLISLQQKGKWEYVVRTVEQQRCVKHFFLLFHLPRTYFWCSLISTKNKKWKQTGEYTPTETKVCFFH